MKVPDVMSMKRVVFKVLIWSRRIASADISAALFSVISGRGKEEEMMVSPIRIIVEHPDDPSSFVDPSVKAMK